MKPIHLLLTASGVLAGVLLEKSLDSRPVPQAAAPAQGKRPSASVVKQPRSAPAAASPAFDLYQSIATSEAADFATLAAEVLALPADSPRRAAALDLLMERWVATDHAAALRFAASLRGDDRTQAFKSGLLRLGQDRFEETFAWMNANLTASACQESQVWLFCGLARQYPLESLAAISQLGPGRLKEDALFTVVSQWAETDINAAFAWFKTAPWTGKSVELYNRLMGVYIRQHPDEARAFIAQLDDGEYWKGRYGQQLVGVLAASDPAKALEFTRSLGDARRRDNAYTDIFEQWSASDPQGAFAEALRMSADPSIADVTKNNASRQAAFALLQEDRGKIVENYDKLPPDIRNEIAGPLITQWMAEDPIAALAWAGKFDPQSPAYNLAISAAATHQAGWDPEAAIATAGRITYEDIRRDTLYSALQNLYRQDPRRAAQVAADPARVYPDVRTAFDRWVAQTGAGEMEFLSSGK